MAEKDIEGLFYCGNVLYVHDLADDVSVSGEEAAIDAAGYLIAKMKGKNFDSKYSSSNVGSARDERRAFLAERNALKLKESSSGRKYIICTMCPNGCRIDADNFTGGRCSKGEAYARNEKLDPKRILTSTVKVKGTGDVIGVRTDRPIPKTLMMEGMKLIRDIEADQSVKVNDVIAEDFLVKGVKLTASDSYRSEKIR